MTYILFLALDRGTWIKVGSLGDLYFREGVYLYVGRARKNAEARIMRHMRGSKRKRWHIDYLREETLPLGVILIPGAWWESAVATWLSTVLLPIPGFGSSDTKAPSSLFYAYDLEEALGKVLPLLEREFTQTSS